MLEKMFLTHSKESTKVAWELSPILRTFMQILSFDACYPELSFMQSHLENYHFARKKGLLEKRNIQKGLGVLSKLFSANKK
jgi:hypothetical protein